MTILVAGAVPVLSSLLILPVSPNSVPAPHASDAFISSMRQAPFDETSPLPDLRRSLPFAAQAPEFATLLIRDANSFFPNSRREASNDDWSALGFRANGPRRSLGRQLDFEGLQVNSKVVLNDPDWHINTPIRRSGWQTEDSVKLPFLGPLFVVGQLGVNSDSVERQQYNLVSKTGLGLKLPAWLGGEIQVRGGRSKTNYDPDTDTLLTADQVKTFVEVSTRWPLATWLNVEYTGQALHPALNPSERDALRINQDLRLAVPLSNSGQFQLGAKYKWDDTAQTPWLDRMKVYIGLEFKR